MEDNFRFDIPAHHKSIIKVVGVGGGGSNAVTHMYNQGIKDVEFVIVNTDNQALNSSTVPNKIQIGTGLTEGLGAGANPEMGKKAAIENKEEIRDLLSHDTKMVFVTAGMGGGTGTGAAPVIAQIAKELDILTVGIVTAPFSFEGRRKMQAAADGIEQLKNACDTVLVISNDKLREVYGNLSIRTAFAQADTVLTTAAKSIAEIITVTSEINVDFQDVRTVMKDSGPAVMGSAVASGENRARRAAEQALSSPLLNNTEVRGAKKILLSMAYGENAELTMDELSEITDYIEEQAGFEAEVIWGQGVDETLDDAIRVTVIATGFAEKGLTSETARKVYDLESKQQVEQKVEQKAEQKEMPQSNSNSTYRSSEVEDNLPKPKQEKIVFNLDEEFEISEAKTEDQATENTPSPTPNAEPSIEERLEAKRRKLIEQSQERIRKLKDLNDYTGDGTIKDQYEIPSYLRRNVSLKSVPNSNENNISRYNLNDDDDLLGDNKFLHDNVD